MKKLFFSVLFISANALATPVNVNTADAKTIADALTNIGIKKAEAIVADRTKNGPFKTVDDLKRVMGIGDKIIAANKDDILLTDAKPVAPPPAPAATPATPKSQKPSK